MVIAEFSEDSDQVPNMLDYPAEPDFNYNGVGDRETLYWPDGSGWDWDSQDNCFRKREDKSQDFEEVDSIIATLRRVLGEI